MPLGQVDIYINTILGSKNLLFVERGTDDHKLFFIAYTIRIVLQYIYSF